MTRWLSAGGVWVLGAERPSRPCRPPRTVGVSMARAAVHASTLQPERLLQSDVWLLQVEQVAACAAAVDASSPGGGATLSR
jgi:hypothetical protein